MMLIFVLKALQINSRSKKILKYLIFSIPFFLFLAPLIMGNIESKLLGEGSGSSMLRLYDLLMGLNIISKNPFWGIGMDPLSYFKYNENIFIDFYSYEVTSLQRGNSNGLMTIGMHLGLPILILYLISVFQQKIFPHRFFFGLFFLLACSTEPISFSIFNMVVSFSALNHNNSKVRYFKL